MARALHQAAPPLKFERPNLTMRLRLSLCLLTSLLALPLVDAQTPAPTPTVDELVAKNLQAKGGAAALDAIKTIRFEGRHARSTKARSSSNYTQTKKRPGKVRTDAALQGMTLVQAYDGTRGWKISPFRGRKDPEKMSADDAKSLIEDAEIDGPLVDWKAEGQDGRIISEPKMWTARRRTS